MYSIPEFDRNGFNPQVHNSFVRNRKRMEAQNMDMEEEEDRIVQEERKVRKTILGKHSTILFRFLKLFLL